MLGFAKIRESGLADRIIHKIHTHKFINLHLNKYIKI